MSLKLISKKIISLILSFLLLIFPLDITRASNSNYIKGHTLAPSTETKKGYLARTFQLNTINKLLKKAVSEAVSKGQGPKDVLAQIRADLKERAEAAEDGDNWYFLFKVRGKYYCFVYFKNNGTLSEPLYTGEDLKKTVNSIKMLNPYTVWEDLKKVIVSIAPKEVEGVLTRDNVSRMGRKEVKRRLKGLAKKAVLTSLAPGDVPSNKKRANAFIDDLAKKKRIEIVRNFSGMITDPSRKGIEGWVDLNHPDIIFINRDIWEKLTDPNKAALLSKLIIQSENIRKLGVTEENIDRYAALLAVSGENLLTSKLKQKRSQSGYGTELTEEVRRLSLKSRPGYVGVTSADVKAEEVPLLSGIMNRFNENDYKKRTLEDLTLYVITDDKGRIKLPAELIPDDGRYYDLIVGSKNTPVEIKFRYDERWGQVADVRIYDLVTQSSEKGGKGLPVVSWHFSPDSGIVSTSRNILLEEGLDELIKRNKLDALYPLFRYAPVEFEEFLMEIYPGMFDFGELSIRLMNLMSGEYPDGVVMPDTVDSAKVVFEALEEAKLPDELTETSKKILQLRIERYLMNAFSLKEEDLPDEYNQKMMDKINKLDALADGMKNREVGELLTTVALDFTDAIEYKPAWLREGVKLRFHQKLAIRRLREMINALLGDEPGIGKTIESIGAALEKDSKKVVIVAKAQTLQFWKDEIAEKTNVPADQIKIIEGSPRTKMKRLEDSKDDNIRFVIISDDTVASGDEVTEEGKRIFKYKDKINELGADYYIFDEGHRYRKGSKRTEAVTQIGAEEGDIEEKTEEKRIREVVSTLGDHPERKGVSKLVLSATPMTGDDMSGMEEMIRMLDPSFVREDNLSRMNSKLRELMMRRLKKELPSQFVSLKQDPVDVVMTEPWRTYYKAVEKILKEAVEAGEIRGLEVAFELRKAAVHPRIISKRFLERLENMSGIPQPIPELSTPSPKMQKLFEIAREQAEAGEKTVVFSLSREVINTMAKLLEDEGYGVVLLTGKENSKQMTDKQNEFRTDSKKQIFLTTYQMGAESLNLEAANMVVKIDLPWEVYTDIQAENRAHRVTQTKPVTVKSLLSKETIDRRLLEILTRKRVRFDETVDGFLGIDEYGEEYVRMATDRLGEFSDFDKFYRLYSEMKSDYTLGHISIANDKREEVASDLARYYDRLTESLRFSLVFNQLADILRMDTLRENKDKLIKRKVNKKNPLVVGDLFSKVGNVRKAIVRAHSEKRLEGNIPKDLWKVFEIDPAGNMLSASEEENLVDKVNIESIESDVNQAKAGIEDTSLDIVITDSLSYMPNSKPPSGPQISRRVRGLSEMARMLTNGGLFVLVTSRPLPQPMQDILREHFGIEPMVSERLRLSKEEIERMTGGDKDQQKRIKRILASTNVFIGRKVSHEPHSIKRLVELSRHKGNFDFEERGGRRGGFIGEATAALPSGDDQIGIADIDEMPELPAIDVQFAEERLMPLTEEIDWEEKKAEILAAYNRYMDEYGIPPDPYQLALSVGLSIPALGYGVLLINYDDNPPFDMTVEPGPEDERTATSLSERGWTRRATPEEQPELETASDEKLPTIWFGPGSWNPQITSESVRQVFEFYEDQFGRRPTFADMCKFFFGSTKRAISNNFFRLMSVLKELPDLNFRKPGRRRAPPVEVASVEVTEAEEPSGPSPDRSAPSGPGMPTPPVRPDAPAAPPPPPAPAAGELTGDGAFYLQNITKPLMKRAKAMKGLINTAAKQLASMGEVKFDDPDKDITRAWSLLLRKSAKINRLPTILEVKKELDAKYPGRYTVGGIVQKVIDINRKLGERKRWISHVRSGSEELLIKKKIWTDQTAGPHSAQAAIDSLGLAEVMFEKEEADRLSDEDLESLFMDIEENPGIGKLADIANVDRDELISLLKNLNHRRWVGGQEEFTTGITKDDELITTGASTEIAKRYKTARDTLEGIESVYGIELLDMVMNYLVAATDFKIRDYSSITDLTETFVKWIVRITEQKNADELLGYLQYQIEDLLETKPSTAGRPVFINQTILDNLKILSPKVHVYILNILINRMSDKKLSERELRDEIKTVLSDELGPVIDRNAVAKKEAYLDLVDVMASNFGSSRAKALAGNLTVRPPSGVKGVRELQTEDIIWLKDLFAEMDKKEIDYVWPKEKDNAFAAFMKDEDNQDIIKLPAANVVEFFDLAKKYPIETGDKIDLFIKVYPALVRFKEGHNRIQNAIKMFSDAQKVSPELYDDLLAAFDEMKGLDPVAFRKLMDIFSEFGRRGFDYRWFLAEYEDAGPDASNMVKIFKLDNSRHIFELSPEIFAEIFKLVNDSDMGDTDKFISIYMIYHNIDKVKDESVDKERLVNICGRLSKISRDLMWNFLQGYTVCEIENVNELFSQVNDYLDNNYDPELLSFIVFPVKTDFEYTIPISKLNLFGKIYEQCTRLGMQEDDIGRVAINIAVSGIVPEELSRKLDEISLEIEGKGLEPKDVFSPEVTGEIGVGSMINGVWTYIMHGGRAEKEFPAEIIGEDDPRYSGLHKALQTYLPFDIRDVLEQNGLNLKFINSDVKVSLDSGSISGTNDVLISTVFLNLVNSREFIKKEIRDEIDDALKGELYGEVRHKISMSSGGKSLIASNQDLAAMTMRGYSEMVKNYDKPFPVLNRGDVRYQTGPFIIRKNVDAARRNIKETAKILQFMPKDQKDIDNITKAAIVMQRYFPVEHLIPDIIFKANKAALLEKEHSGMLPDSFYRAVRGRNILEALLWFARRNDQKDKFKELSELRKKLRIRIRKLADRMFARKFEKMKKEGMLELQKRIYDDKIKSEEERKQNYIGSDFKVMPDTVPFLGAKVSAESKLQESRDFANSILVNEILIKSYVKVSGSKEDVWPDYDKINNRIIDLIILVSTTSDLLPADYVLYYVFEHVCRIGALDNFDNIELFKKYPELLDHWQVKAAKSLLEILENEVDAFMVPDESKGYSKLQVAYILSKWIEKIGLVDYTLINASPFGNNMTNYPLFQLPYLRDLEKARDRITQRDISALMDESAYKEFCELVEVEEIILTKGLSMPAVLEPAEKILYVDMEFLGSGRAKDESISMERFLAIKLFADIQREGCNVDQYIALNQAMGQLGTAPFGDKRYNWKNLVKTAKKAFKETDFKMSPEVQVMFDFLVSYVEEGAGLGPKAVERRRGIIYDKCIEFMGEDKLYGWDQFPELSEKKPAPKESDKLDQDLKVTPEIDEAA
ncbi:helicase-related protein [Candidatus Auribacterota bacterium]